MTGAGRLERRGLRPGKCFPTRIFGKPMTITEFDYAYPNRFRAEGGAVAGAYAALQDWDGLYRFAYAHCEANVQKQRPSVFFDVAADPIKALSERIGSCFFCGATSARPRRLSGRGFQTLLRSLATLGEYPQDVWQLGLMDAREPCRPPRPPGSCPMAPWH